MSPAALGRLVFAASAAFVSALPAGAAGARAQPRRVAIAASPDAITLGGVDYVDLGAFCERFGLRLRGRTSAAGPVVYGSKWSKLEFEVDSRDQTINGLRVFFGDPVRRYRGRVWLSRIDAELLLTPMLRPGADQPRVPALRKIVLDPGHGGNDSGKTNDRLKIAEKDLTLDTSRRLKKLLEAQGYEVLLTRADDRYVDLPARPAFARRARADLFISLHYNSVAARASGVTGVEVFTLTPQHQYSTADSAHDDDQGARIALPGNAHDHWNTVLGASIGRELLDDLKVPDRGLKRARWKVLTLGPCPAVLVESGYLSNDAEARKIATPAYRQRIAQAIAEGVRAYGATLAQLRAKS
jgi:N-acetylmuramoyl-L-alanine amidase